MPGALNASKNIMFCKGPAAVSAAASNGDGRVAGAEHVAAHKLVGHELGHLRRHVLGISDAFCTKGHIQLADESVLARPRAPSVPDQDHTFRAVHLDLRPRRTRCP